MTEENIASMEQEEAPESIEEMELVERDKKRLEQLQWEYGELIGHAGECQQRIYRMTDDLEIMNVKLKQLNVEAQGLAQKARESQAKKQKAMAKRLSKLRKVEDGDSLREPGASHPVDNNLVQLDRGGQLEQPNV